MGLFWRLKNPKENAVPHAFVWGEGLFTFSIRLKKDKIFRGFSCKGRSPNKVIPKDDRIGQFVGVMQSTMRMNVF